MRALVLLALLLVSVACGGGGGGDSAGGSQIAPSSLNYKVLNLNVSSGSGVFATSGTGLSYYFPNAIYVTEGDGFNTTSAAGTYTMSVVDDDTVSIARTIGGQAVSTTANFSSSTSGSYSSAYGSGAQTGTFAELNNASYPPASVTGQSIRMTVLDGDLPLASSGSATITFTSSNTYTIIGDGVNISNSTGTYSYSATSNYGYSTLVLTDSSIGSTLTYYLLYKSTSAGAFSARYENVGQAGLFY